MSYELWVWVMGYGLWVMGYGLWVMGCGLWVMGWTLTLTLTIFKYQSVYFYAKKDFILSRL